MSLFHLFISISVYLSVLGLTSVAPSICFDCVNLGDPDECKAFHACEVGERCFKEVEETDNGTASYNWGCASAELCQLESSVAARKRLSTERCFECCDGNFCNFGPCTRDFCAEVTCQNGATCTNSALKAVCDCDKGYTGELCEIEIQECLSAPCQNGAKCIDLIGQYSCVCQPGFTGNNCEIDIDDCAVQPCFNGGTCIDAVNAFSCNCVPGYTGTICQIEINECESNPCQFNGTCTDELNSYQCDCIPGITGINCETNIDECESVTCQNGASCEDLINGFQCNCVFGFAGVYCEQDLGRVCYSCENIDTVDNCKNMTICGKDEECYMEHELTSPGNFNFNLGCVPNSMCNYFQQAKKRNTVALQLCYECCDSNGCNHHACVDTRGPQASG
ncbi:DNA repair protein Rad9 [Mactra antiquata]